MPSEVDRARRVGHLLQRELATLIVSDVADPRIRRVSITEVSVTRDLKLATVFVTNTGDDTQKPEILGVLNRAAGYLRHLLGQRVYLRVTPELRFRYDTSIERGIALSNLIDAAISSDSDSTTN